MKVKTLTRYETALQKENVILEYGQYRIQRNKSQVKERFDYCRQFSFAIPNQEALQAIKDLQMSVVELGAGSGYWASELDQMGVEIVAFDNQTFGQKPEWFFENSPDYWAVQIGDENILNNYPDHALMLCWPNYDEPFAFNALNKFKGDTLIYIGEYEGGCCASDEFFDALYENWTEQSRVSIPRWWGMHDELTIYKKD